VGFHFGSDEFFKWFHFIEIKSFVFLKALIYLASVGWLVVCFVGAEASTAVGER
jgi:hypothetical protein